MEKFKAGDLVKVISATQMDASWFSKGDIGKVVSPVSGGQGLIEVDFNNRGNLTVHGEGIWAVCDDQIKLCDHCRSVSPTDERTEAEKLMEEILLG
jgi:hypothetical protein